MIVASAVGRFKVDSPVELAQELENLVKQAARQGSRLYEVERQVFESVLKIGHAATEMFLKAPAIPASGGRALDGQPRAWCQPCILAGRCEDSQSCEGT